MIDSGKGAAIDAGQGEAHGDPRADRAVLAQALTLATAAGPTVVGWIADSPGGLSRGFVVSAALLAAGSVLAAMQRPLAR